jgi:hypothetical protein
MFTPALSLYEKTAAQYTTLLHNKKYTLLQTSNSTHSTQTSSSTASTISNVRAHNFSTSQVKTNALGEPNIHTLITTLNVSD